MHFFPTHIAKFSFYCFLICPTVGNRILDNSRSNTNAGVGGQFQAFVMDEKITNFAVQSSVEKTPVEEVKTDVAVDRPRTVESLLGEGVAMVVNNRLLQIPHRPIRPT